jgi:lipopolysaccharide export system protein LptC
MSAAYTHKRTAHRWRLLTVMLTGVFFAFGSFWLVQMVNRDDSLTQVGGPLNEPDYIVENFSFVRMGETGKPRYVVSGSRLAHLPLGDVSQIEKPVVQSMAPERARMTIHANQARIRHAEDQIDLIGNVDVVRPAAPKVQAMRVRTEALTVLPDEEILKTDQAVEMKLGEATLRGTGMVANNATGRLHLASRGQIVYPPRAPR